MTAFIRKLAERHRLRSVIVGYPDSMWISVDAADVKEVRALVETRTDLEYAYVQAHPTATHP